MAKLLKYQQQFIKWMENASSIEILNEYGYYLQGDAYNGCRTKQGQWKYEQLRKELQNGLIDCGFIKHTDIIKEI